MHIKYMYSYTNDNTNTIDVDDDDLAWQPKGNARMRALDVPAMNAVIE